MSKSGETGLVGERQYDGLNVHVRPYGEEEILNELRKVNLVVKPYLRDIGTNY